MTCPNENTARVRVFRFNPETDQSPRYETYEVPIGTGKSIFNALVYINEHYDGGLAHYVSCRRGVCAGCLVRVNGKVRRACTEILRGDVTIDPVSKDRVVKDLLVEQQGLVTGKEA